MALVDVHCHLDAPAYPHPAVVCQQSQQAGVEAVVAAGTGLASNERILTLQQGWPEQVWAALGLHPERLDLSWQGRHIGTRPAWPDDIGVVADHGTGD